MHLAATEGDLDALQRCLNHEASKKLHSGCPPLDRTMLHVAAEFGRDCVVEWLLLEEERLFGRDHRTLYDDLTYTPLHLAALNGHTGAVKILMDKEWSQSCKSSLYHSLSVSAPRGTVECGRKHDSRLQR